MWEECRSLTPGPGCSSDEDELFVGCDCLDTCDARAGCACLRYGDNYDADGRLRLVDGRAAHPLVECGAACACRAAVCANRVTQRATLDHLQAAAAGAKGSALRTLRPVSVGCFVAEYAGEVISMEESARRAVVNATSQHNYQFVVNEHVGGEGDVLQTIVDARYKSNVSRFLNHSCEPNLAVEIVRHGSSWPHICFFASRHIAADEELTYTYATLCTPAGSSQKPCRCGAVTCANWLPSGY